MTAPVRIGGKKQPFTREFPLARGNHRVAMTAMPKASANQQLKAVWHHPHATQRCGEPAVDHRRRDMLRDFGAGAVAEIARKQAGKHRGDGHRLLPHALHRALAYRMIQHGRNSARIERELVLPGMAQIQQHHHAELGCDIAQRDKADLGSQRHRIAQ
jgi:hypothetical protein